MIEATCKYCDQIIHYRNGYWTHPMAEEGSDRQWYLYNCQKVKNYGTSAEPK